MSFFDRILSSLFAPYVILLFIAIVFSVIKRKKNKGFFALQTVMISMLIWRALFSQKMISSRYFSGLIVPAVVYSSYLFSLLDHAPSPSKRNTFRSKYGITIVLLLNATAVLWSATKLCNPDLYHYNAIQLYQKCDSTESDDSIIISDSIRDKDRLSYYAQTQNAVFIQNIRGNSLDYILKTVPDFFYYRNVYFVLEESNTPIALHALTDSLKEFGTFRQIGKSFLSSSHKKRVVLYLFTPNNKSFLPNNPKNIRGTRLYNLLSHLKVLRGTIKTSTDYITLTETNSYFVCDDLIPVNKTNRIDFDISLSNIGLSTAKVYIGLEYYDKEKKRINSNNYPYDAKNLNVIYSKDSVIAVDSSPTWEKNCSIAIYDDEAFCGTSFSKILEQRVINVNKVSDYEFHLITNSPLNSELSSETKIRIHNISNQNNYLAISLLSPGMTYRFTNSISKYTSYNYYSRYAIPNGVCYVKPVFLSISSDPKLVNTIKINKFNIVF